MTSRPFFESSLVELESTFNRERHNPQMLQVLLTELSHRTTIKAARLRAQVNETLETLRHRPKEMSARESASSDTSSPDASRASAPSSGLARRAASTPAISALAPQADNPLPQVDNSPLGILGAWTALEALSPPAFRRIEDLAGGDRRNVAHLEQRRLPWEGQGERARPHTRLYYQIVLGTVDMQEAIARLMAVYSDTRPERPAARGEAVLACVTVDVYGRPTQSPAVAVSSFGWAIPRALARDLQSLGGWRNVEQSLVESLDERLRPDDPEEAPAPLTYEVIQETFASLMRSLDIPPDLVHPPQYAIRVYEPYRNPNPPEPQLLNSFFLDDLAMVADQFRDGDATDNLKLYLGLQTPESRRDLLHDRAALEAAVRPGLTPPARWPAPRRNPLVLLQQAAVNLALSDLRKRGILAVNGPPGTGKTTLLRDVVAAVVTERARVMSGYEDPEAAFGHSGERLKAGQGWLHLYQMDAPLRGFEMLVASSNNKAVENVSAELPALGAIAADATDLRYFKTLSDALMGRETWGLIAAVLGNSANRYRFRQGFWWDKDFGLATYLAAAAGTPQLIEEVDEATGQRVTRIPRIVLAEDPPRDHAQALERWRASRASFRATVARSEQILKQLEEIRTLVQEQPAYQAASERAREELETLTQRIEHANAKRDEAARAAEEARRAMDEANAAWNAHETLRPGFFSRLFRTARARQWQETAREKALTLGERAREAELTRTQAAMVLREADQLKSSQATATAALSQAQTRLLEAVQRLESARQTIGAGLVDAQFLALPHGELHRRTPWLLDVAQRARDDVFVAAIALHKAFIDAAAKPIRHNIGALMNVFGGARLVGDKRESLLPQLWSSLFLVVPVISTTFASVGRMLGRLPPQSLGWLLIDEAGQALPQAAVGALMRTRRAVVVGDPLQIEPVVTLPNTFTETVCARFGVDPTQFNAPEVSVQTRADEATSYCAEFLGRDGSRTVGVPLLVHRRCDSPMFDVANAIAYERLMVQAKKPAESAIRDVLGKSHWIDVSGGASDKWSPAEGEVVLNLLRRLAKTRVAPDLYIVTPFVVVQDNLRKLLSENGILEGWVEDPRAWTRQRVGTVHVVQGREAEAVIFVLGAPAIEQAGARNWAGGRPNLLNVALTRAKEVVYVVGNRTNWCNVGVFRELHAHCGGP